MPINVRHNKTYENKLTISGTSGSLGLGQHIKLHIATKTPSNVINGFQAPVGGIFKISKQILPLTSMFGWYIGVMKVTRGGSNGYLELNYN